MPAFRVSRWSGPVVHHIRSEVSSRDPNSAGLVSRLPRVRIEGGEGEAIHGCVMHRNEDLARVDAARDERARLHAAPCRVDTDPFVMTNSESCGILTRNLDVGFFRGELVENCRAFGASLRVPLARTPTPREQEQWESR